MNQELKSHSTIGDYAGIMFFAKHVLTNDKVVLSSLLEQCQVNQDISLNFNCAVEAFAFLGLTESNSRSIQSTGIVTYTGSDEDLRKKLCGRCLDILLSEGLIDINAVSLNESSVVFSLSKRAFSFDSAIFRNMLISLDFLFYKDGLYYVENNSTEVFAKKISTRRKQVSLEDLKKSLEEQQRMGDDGEQFVMHLEKLRLCDAKAKRVIRISQVDVAAGYDIASFESDDSPSFDRFIEVKTYTGKLHFHWSANEIEIAKLRRERYCLCLVDYSRIKEDGYLPFYIVNPFDNVFESNEWLRSPDSYSFEFIGSD